MTMYINKLDFTTNISLSLNKSEVPHMDIYAAYRATEKEQLMAYKWVAYVIGSLIVLSNLVVVVSSGLILRKGQQPKSTYLLLGNVSLADTIIGLSLIFGMIVDNCISANVMCVFQMGTLVCPAMVSIFSVGFIAIDRYFYILHGLYYQRWFNTRKTRISILCIWMISITLGFLPATGWKNTELILTRCYYVALFPGALILINSLLSIIPIAVVAVLYTIILVKALKNANSIKTTIKVDAIGKDTHLRMYRGTINEKKIIPSFNKSNEKSNAVNIVRSASFNSNNNNGNSKLKYGFLSVKSKSNDDIVNGKPNTAQSYYDIKQNKADKTEYESKSSIYTIKSNNYSNDVLSITSTNSSESNVNRTSIAHRKIKEPNKWRAVTIVMLTSGSIIFTWMPFFITVIFFVFCEEKLTNPKCIHIRNLLGGPVATLAFFNSLLNPLIYAWWHKGFKRSIKTYYQIYIKKFYRHK